MPPKPGSSDSPDRNDGLFVITQTGSWIANADTKAGLLAAGLTLLGTAAFGRLRHVITLFPLAGWREWVGTGLLVAGFLAVAFSAVCLVSALSARTTPPQKFTRYAFPALATVSEGFTPTLNSDEQREEAWIQVRALALIAMKKFMYFKRGLYGFCVAIILLAPGSLITP